MFVTAACSRRRVSCDGVGVTCGGNGYHREASSDKLASKCFAYLPSMSERKLRLEWIRKVLVDLDARGERAGEAAYESLQGPTVLRFASRLRSEHHETEAHAASSGEPAGPATTAQAS